MIKSLRDPVFNVVSQSYCERELSGNLVSIHSQAENDYFNFTYQILLLNDID